MPPSRCRRDVAAAALLTACTTRTQDKEDNRLVEILFANVEKPVELTVYSSKTDTYRRTPTVARARSLVTCVCSRLTLLLSQWRPWCRA